MSQFSQEDLPQQKRNPDNVTPQLINILENISDRKNSGLKERLEFFNSGLSYNQSSTNSKL